RTDGLQSGRDGRGPAMDAMKSVGVHVVGQPRRASDAGDDHELLARDPQLGEDRLHGAEDGVIAAAGAPAYFLIGDEVFFGQRGRYGRDFAHVSSAPGSHRSWRGSRTP